MEIKFADLEKSQQELEKEIKRIWDKNNMSEKWEKAYCNLMCVGKAKIEFEGKEIDLIVTPVRKLNLRELK